MKLLKDDVFGHNTQAGSPRFPTGSCRTGRSARCRPASTPASPGKLSSTWTRATPSCGSDSGSASASLRINPAGGFAGHDPTPTKREPTIIRLPTVRNRPQPFTTVPQPSPTDPEPTAFDKRFWSAAPASGRANPAGRKRPNRRQETDIGHGDRGFMTAHMTGEANRARRGFAETSRPGGEVARKSAPHELTVRRFRTDASLSLGYKPADGGEFLGGLWGAVAVTMGCRGGRRGR